MRGLVIVAFKLLVNDRAKFAALLVGITFAVFLMVMMTSIFSGILAKSSATVTNVGAKVWIMDRSVTTPASSIPLPDYVLDAARSMDGVRFAVPLYSSAALVKLADGTFQPVTVMGLDDSSLLGRPELLEGNIQDIYAENGFLVVKDEEYPKLENPQVGTVLEINDHRAVIVGIAKVASSGLFGLPTLYTTFNRALQYLPNTRFTISYILVEPKSLDAIPGIKAQVDKLGYVALTDDDFIKRITDFYIHKTGLGTNILLMTAISFLVGLSISGQTFYTFIIENLERFGALKAIGARSSELVAMILFQAGFAALVGYGLGVGLCTGIMTLAKLKIPDYASIITYQNLALALGMVVIIAGVSSFMGVRRVLRIEPFEIFRS